MDARTPTELLAEWLSGNLDPDGTARLLELCRAQSELVGEAADWQGFDRLLRASLLDAGPEAFAQEVAARCGIVESAPEFVGGVHRRVRWRRWVMLAAAACFVLAVGSAMWWRTQPVAVVQRLEAAQWREGARALRDGEKLRRGRVSLASGFAALHFERGAELLVEGPAELELLSAMRVRLHAGNAFAHVPKEAIGFTVEGPTGRVIDRGTDFGVRVSEGSMEVHVLKGAVDAGRGSDLQPLRENEGLQMSADRVSAIAADQGRFLTRLPPKAHGAIGWIRWSFDESEGEAAHSETVRLDTTNRPARLLSLDGASDGPQWTTGQFGSALSFDGEDDYVQTDFAGIAGSAARTVAFWIKVPRDFQPRNSYAMVCWGSARELTEGWQISINPRPDEGPVGGVRVARIGGPIIGNTDLRDDRWHHLAVVFYGGEQPAPSTQVLIYLDGQLERTVRKGVLNVQTDVATPNARKVAFGLNIAPVNPDPRRPSTWRVFRGCLDEMFICNAALSQEQVRDLMTRNHTEAFAPHFDR